MAQGVANHRRTDLKQAHCPQRITTCRLTCLPSRLALAGSYPRVPEGRSNRLTRGGALVECVVYPKIELRIGAPARTAVDRVAEIENVLPSIRGTDHAEAHIVFHFGALLQLLEELVTRKSASVGARIGHVDCGARPIPQGPLGHYSIGLTTRCSAARNS